MLADARRRKTMTTVNDAMKTLEQNATEVITAAAVEYIQEALAEFGPDAVQYWANVLRHGDIQSDIDHHVEKVFERGYNEGRVAARARFLVEDWSMDGRENFLRVINDVLLKHGYGTAAHQPGQPRV